MRDVEAVCEDEREDRNDDAVEKEIGEESYADGGDDEEGIAAPFQTDGRLGVICGHDFGVKMFQQGRRRWDGGAGMEG
jgi:hypothetical protein